MDTIAARGMAGLRMADVGERAGMSPGHILYYYRSKQRLLSRRCAGATTVSRSSAPASCRRSPTARERLARFIAIYLPTGADHPEWLLWLQIWALGAEDPEVAAITAELNSRWADDLAALVRFGVERGEFATVDAAASPRSSWPCSTASACTCSTTRPMLDPPARRPSPSSIAAGQLGFDPPMAATLTAARAIVGFRTPF